MSDYHDHQADLADDIQRIQEAARAAEKLRHCFVPHRMTELEQRALGEQDAALELMLQREKEERRG